MQVFMVERYVPGATVAGLQAAVGRMADTVGRLERRGTRVRHVRCLLIPSEGSVFCVFEGPSREAIEEANRQAGFEFDQVVEAIEIPV